MASLFSQDPELNVIPGDHLLLPTTVLRSCLLSLQMPIFSLFLCDRFCRTCKCSFSAELLVVPGDLICLYGQSSLFPRADLLVVPRGLLQPASSPRAELLVMIFSTC